MFPKFLLIFCDMIRSLIRPSRFLMILVCVAVCNSCTRQKKDFKGTVVFPIEQAPEIKLWDQNGNPFNLREIHGKIVVLFFGFSYCPDVCPTTLMELKKVHSSLAQKAEKVQFVFITVDSQRDDGNTLKNYVTLFDFNLFALSGNPQELKQVYRSYGVYHERIDNQNPEGSYTINHTNSIFILDEDGNWRINHSAGAKSEEIVQDILLLLK